MAWRGEKSIIEERIPLTAVKVKAANIPSAAGSGSMSGAAANDNVVSQDETDGRRHRSLKLTYRKKVYVFLLEPGKKVGELVEEIKAKTESEICEIKQPGGGTYGDDDEALNMELPFQVIVGTNMTTVKDERDLDVPLQQTWIDDKNKSEIVAYLEEKLNEGHLIKKRKYVFGILQDKLKERGDDLDDTLISVLTDDYTPQQTLQMVMKLLHMGAKAPGKKTGNEEIDKKVIPLHLSIKKDGYEDVALALLSWGALIDERNEKGETVLEIAYRDQRDELMAWIIQHMHPKMVRATFSYTFPQDGSSSNEQISLRSMIKKSKDAEGKKRKPMKKSVRAVLDSLWEETDDGAIAYYFPLECDEMGRGPDEKGFHLEGKSCLQELALAGGSDYVKHNVVRLLVDRKWRLYASTAYILGCVLYLIATACLTTALVLALDTEDPKIYGSSTSEAIRITCEVAVLFWMLLTLIFECFEFISGKLRYVKSPSNYLDLGSVLFLFITIITRFTGCREQWWFFSGGYLLAVLRLTKFFPLCRHLRAYLITFKRTLWDFLSFFILFALINFAFTGAFAAALRYNGKLTSTNSTRTSDYGNILFSAFTQILVDSQSALPFYKEDHFVYGSYVYPTIMLIIFLFVNLVMLLNLLIAQLTNTYTKTRTDAKIEVLKGQAEMVAKVESFNRRIQRFYYKDMKKLTHKGIRKFKLTCNYEKTTDVKLDEMHDTICELDHQLKLTNNYQKTTNEKLDELKQHLIKVMLLLEKRQANDAL